MLSSRRPVPTLNTQLKIRKARRQPVRRAHPGALHRVDRAGLPQDEPDQRLVGFAKVAVAAGSSAVTHVVLDPDAYRAWDADRHEWTTWTGAVELRVGRSSRDVAARVEVRVGEQP